MKTNSLLLKTFLFYTIGVLTTENPSLAFSLVANSNSYDTNQWQYLQTDGIGTMQLTHLVGTSGNEIDSFVNMLTNHSCDYGSFCTATGWNFTKSSDPNGVVYVEDYNPIFEYSSDYNQHTLTGIAGSISSFYTNNYTDFTQGKVSSDPSLYWIQRVKSNHEVIFDTTLPGCSLITFKDCKLSEQHGNNMDIIDIPRNQNNPFYGLILKDPGDSIVLPGVAFKDTAKVSDIREDHEFNAELYLARLETPTRDPKQLTVQQLGDPEITKNVSILGGIKWGWKNTYQKNLTRQGTLEHGKIDEFTIADLPARQPFVAWIDNLTRGDEPHSPSISLGAVDPNGDRVIDYNDGGYLVDDIWGTGISSLIGKDGKIKLKVATSSYFEGDYQLNIKIGEKNFSFLSSSTLGASSTLNLLSINEPQINNYTTFYSANNLGEDARYFSINSNPTLSSKSVPEPDATAGLIGLGVLGFLNWKRKQKSK
jgi:hypothetical protein